MIKFCTYDEASKILGYNSMPEDCCLSGSYGQCPIGCADERDCGGIWEMNGHAYYNEFSPEKAAWLRELIKRGLIAPGVVDERSIKDVQADELTEFLQCHFFAGIGIWIHTLRLAGWPDDRPVWTGSCPCQPFSAAGKGKAFADDRHLWPEFFRLIAQCRPGVVLGEQVASKDGLSWLDLVCADLEGAGYAVGAVDTCAAGFGAPHIRQRLYWVADSEHTGHRRQEGTSTEQDRNEQEQRILDGNCAACGVADPESLRQCANQPGRDMHDREQLVRTEQRGNGGDHGGNSRMADASGERPQRDTYCGQRIVAQLPAIERTGEVERVADTSSGQLQEQIRRPERRDGAAAAYAENRLPSPTNGFWRDADWLFCRDGRWRPVEPGSSPLAHGAPARVVRLRGYGDGIVAPQAAAFIETVMEVLLA